jgi:hypothetical protein
VLKKESRISGELLDGFETAKCVGFGSWRLDHKHLVLPNTYVALYRYNALTDSKYNLYRHADIA